MGENNIKELKEVEFYAASVNAWYSSALEQDKSLLILSTGGIGLLLTLLTDVGVSSCLTVCLYIGAVLSFLLSIVTVLRIFAGNRKYIEGVIAKNTESDAPELTKLDAIACWAFGVGVLFTSVLCIVVAFNSYTQKELAMGNETPKKPLPLHQDESFNGSARLQPSSTPTAKTNNPTVRRAEQFSVSGSARLRPSSTSNTPAPTNNPPATANTPAPATDSSQKK